MEQNLSDIFDLVEHAIDNAFEGQMNLKFYDYLKDNKTKKHEVDTFIDSTTATELNDLTQELEEYINCLLYTSPSPRDQRGSRMPSSA